MEREKPEYDLCERIEQFIGFEDEMLKYKTKLYCEHCLSFGKEYVDKITDGLYEECENYLKNFNSYEDREKQFIKSYETNLAMEGKEICKEIDSTGVVNNELLLEKAVVYCQFISRQEDVDPKLVERCQKYIDDVNNFNHYKTTFRNVNYDRRENEKFLNMK